MIRDCCLFVRRKTTPPGKKTGYSHPRCFARELQDCSHKITGEHFISRGVLQLFGSTAVTVSGFPWMLKNQRKEISVASLTGKMLCNRHNESLSPLDSLAADFFSFFVSDWTSKDDVPFLTRGYDIERWMLKVLCGLVASGNATMEGERFSNWTPPLEWLEILLGKSDVKEPAGLHVIVGKYRAGHAHLHFAPAFKSESRSPVALALVVSGLGFLFSLEALPPKKNSKTGADTRYRPMAIQLRKSERSRESHFGWPSGPFVEIEAK